MRLQQSQLMFVLISVSEPKIIYSRSDGMHPFDWSGVELMGYRSYGQLIFPTSQMDAYHRLAGGHKDNSLDMWDEQETIDLKYTENQ